LLPAQIARVHPRFKTPHVAIIVHAAFGLVFALTGSFASLLVVATLATLIVYLICCAATIQLQRLDVRSEGAVPFRVPGGPIIPVLAIGVVLWLMSASTRAEFLALGVMLLVETVLYFGMRSMNARPVAA
jgi:amino acid transporter